VLTVYFLIHPTGRPLADGPGPLYFAIAVTAGGAALLGVLMFAWGTALAVELRFDESALVLTYSSGRVRQFDWTEANLRVIFQDTDRPTASHPVGGRRVRMWMHFVDGTKIPPIVLDELCALAPKIGVTVDHAPHPPTGGLLVTLSRPTRIGILPAA
jgi:hypothetical protein